MFTQDALTEIFRSMFDDTIRVRPGMAANDVEAWEFLSQVKLNTTIEPEDGIRFSRQAKAWNPIPGIDRMLPV